MQMDAHLRANNQTPCSANSYLSLHRLNIQYERSGIKKYRKRKRTLWVHPIIDSARSDEQVQVGRFR